MTKIETAIMISAPTSVDSHHGHGMSVVLNPGESHTVIAKSSQLMTIEKRPIVRIVIGSEISLMIGPMIALTRPKTIAAMNASYQ